MTSDGSHTIAVPELNVLYHSRFGAVQESIHVFIQAGLFQAWEQFKSDPLYIFEMGFGTGLNAFLTAIEAEKKQRKIHYTTIEKHALSLAEIQELNYCNLLGNKSLFDAIHQSEWKTDISIGAHFTLKKEPADLLSYRAPHLYHIIYYDAFAPAAQPELWTTEIFEKLYAMLKEKGSLVTYCSKGDVRRAMLIAGFSVKKMPGPPGKREMLWAEKS